MDDLQKEQIDALLMEIDDDCVSKGIPILSIMVVHSDTGAPSTAFWKSVEKHGLRRENESDDAVAKRLKQEAYDFYGKVM